METGMDLQKDVLEELTWEPSVDAAQIGVSAKDGVVILTGTVKSLNEKWLAERAAQRVSGVRAVTDEIVVKLPGDGQYADADLARAAVNALDWNVSIPPQRINILVEGGRVTLKGTVDHYYQKDAAEAAVRNLKGVTDVFSLILVVPSASPVDVIHKIKRALHRAAQIDAESITVQANNGKVILRGNVSTWAERERAELAAWAAPGVCQVQNDIAIDDSSVAA